MSNSQLKTILVQLASDLEATLASYQTTTPAKTTPNDTSQPSSDSNLPTTLAKANNVIDYLVAQIHSEFTEAADDLLATGILNQEQRIGLSHAIGLALDAFNATIDMTPILFTLRSHSTNTESDTPTFTKTNNSSSEPVPAATVSATIAPTEPVTASESIGLSEPTATLATVTILNKADERRLSYGIAYPAQPIGWSDTQGDWCAPEEIEKMAHDFMRNSQRYDMHHADFNLAKDAAVLVESYIAPVDLTWSLPSGATKTINKGSWIVVTHYPDLEVWSRVKAGEFNAYSIHGRGKRKPLVTS